MAGLERGYVGRLERSQYYASLATLQKLAVALDVDLSELTEPVLVTRDKRSNSDDKGSCSNQGDDIGPKLLAAPFQEGFELRSSGVTLVLIDYRWNDGSIVRRWLINPKKVKQSAVVLKPCGEL
jgi:transcriptional regulator with XRE-family HTH domain